MAATKQEKEKVSKIKVKKKLWYKIISPKLFGNKELGETYLESPETAIGRMLRINLKDLTGNVKDQNAYILFKIKSVVGVQLHANLTGYELANSYVKRAVRKNADRLDDCFSLKAKDGRTLVVKPLIITLHKVQRSLKTNLKKQLHTYIEEELAKEGVEGFMANLFGARIQFGARKRLNKLYPVKDVSLRVVNIKGEASAIVEDVAEKLAEHKVAEEPKQEA